jgi:hypothetical protein
MCELHGIGRRDIDMNPLVLVGAKAINQVIGIHWRKRRVKDGDDTGDQQMVAQGWGCWGQNHPRARQSGKKVKFRDGEMCNEKGKRCCVCYGEARSPSVHLPSGIKQ